jgi:hypothetical protein
MRGIMLVRLIAEDLPLIVIIQILPRWLMGMGVYGRREGFP